MFQTTPAPGVSQVLASAGPRVFGQDALASRDGQLWNAQHSRSAGLAETPPTLCAAFHSDRSELAESGGTVVWGVNAKSRAPWSLPKRAGFVQSIEAFLVAWNINPKPFVWTATVAAIQEKLARCRQTLEQIQPGSTQPRKKKKKVSI